MSPRLFRIMGGKLVACLEARATPRTLPVILDRPSNGSFLLKLGKTGIGNRTEAIPPSFRSQLAGGIKQQAVRMSTHDGCISYGGTLCVMLGCCVGDGKDEEGPDTAERLHILSKAMADRWDTVGSSRCDGHCIPRQARVLSSARQASDCACRRDKLAHTAVLSPTRLFFSCAFLLQIFVASEERSTA